ncbi:MAG: zinc ribbon domain-containing protein [Steroidobacteraceae bacterium]
MPFYEYECSSCKFYVEAMQKISDAPLRKCPSCGKSTLTKLVSAPVFRLKGSGWYETDFKSDQESKRNLTGDDTAEAKLAAADEAKAAAPAAETKAAEPKTVETKPAAAKPAAQGRTRARRRAPTKRVPAPKRKSRAKRKRSR